MGGHSWTAYFVKGVYTDQPRLVCNSDVAVVVPQVPLVKLFTLQCGNKYTHPTHAVSRLFYIMVFQVDLSSILRVIYDYSVMSEVTRAYPLLVWGVTLGLLPSCKVGGTHQPGRAGMQ